MKKSYNINEVAKLFNITTNKIRFYEKKGLIRPFREADNEYRKFTDEDIFMLQAILLYRCIGLSIDDIKDIFKDNTTSNYLNHFNRQWEVVNSEIHRLNDVRFSIGKIIDNIYNNENIESYNDIFKIIENTNKLNEIRNNWSDKWNFDNWADSYDNDVLEDITNIKMYKNYNLILDSVYNLAVDFNNSNISVLEIGVGTGNLAGRFLENNYDIVGIDQSREMLNVAKKKYLKLKVRIGEFLKIPFDNKAFDVIVSTYAFHHLNNEEKSIAIGEMLRVLKDNGKIIIGDLMFKNEEDKQNLIKGLSNEQIEEINDEYFSYIDLLIEEFKKFNKKVKYTKIDTINYIVEIFS